MTSSRYESTVDWWTSITCGGWGSGGGGGAEEGRGEVCTHVLSGGRK